MKITKTLLGAIVVAALAAGGVACTPEEAPAPTPSVAKKPVNNPRPQAAPKPKSKPVATFKVWGTAPSGADVTYGSDGTNLQGSAPMTKTLPVEDGAMYYVVTAQLQGGGDIHCSITIGGQTKQGRAQGGYNICSAQLSGGLFGSWS